ncbi:transporter sec9 [Sarocladium implicatum]|nr:transporter sec9 [Sarocladium implicatum]
MKRFGIGKKSDDGDDGGRSALFSRSSKKSSSSASDNPYAQQGGAPDPYADDNKYANMTPYQQAKAGVGGQQRPGGLPSGPASGQRPGGYGSPAPGSNGSAGNGYGAPPPSGYGADRYGSGGGYGGNRYESKPSNGPSAYGGGAPSARGPGGYGGFGRQDDEPDNNRDALFSGAQERQTQKQQTPGAPDPYGAQPSAAGGGAYGGYGEQRELTEEEQEEADYQAILAEKRQVQQESAQSVNRSVQMARQANEVGRATLARLGAQGERLHNTEKHLDMAANQNKVAQDRAAELKTLNRSMFAVHVGNPFTSKQRQQKADEEVMNRHRTEREQREATRRDGFNANQRMESSFRDMQRAPVQKQARKKDYGKFNLEDEEGADELEDQIDDGLDELEGQVHMMNMVGRAIGKEVDTQNGQIERIMGKSDAVDDATRMNRERLARIK